MYYRHSGYPGGIKSISLDKLRASHPERIIETAVRGMLPKGPLGRDMFRKLRVYAGAEHNHAAPSTASTRDLIGYTHGGYELRNRPS